MGSTRKREPHSYSQNFPSESPKSSISFDIVLDRLALSFRGHDDELIISPGDRSGTEAILTFSLSFRLKCILGSFDHEVQHHHGGHPFSARLLALIPTALRSRWSWLSRSPQFIFRLVFPQLLSLGRIGHNDESCASLLSRNSLPVGCLGQ
ncbi:hypothetical protein POX_a00327 [Penicillium oxalicum]|uniref:hypothetical protein n=1 Tax=Penicillium oxalicum TaxID=69781 RepID=UPI0020B7A917|nr:hypothetical protein POX_a00327 [Penicillium oxalicum]KAI2793743.1 hypothetical protein POX_a00327 [Penicillium oxalicum]